MKKFLSHYHPGYIRSLVYMLQASEYDMHEYLNWFCRAQDFRTVETRKKLVMTKKALALYIMAWATFCVSYAVAMAGFFFWELPGPVLL